MRPKSYTSEAIILARKSYSEADRILIAFTKYYGKTSFIAKGIRKPKSKKRGTLEVFSQLKLSAARSKSLDIITETEIINNFSDFRKDLKKVSVAYFFVETVGRLTQEGEKNLKLYSLLLTNLTSLATSNELGVLRRTFIYDVLVLLGFWPKGKKMENHDLVLENITERKMNSVRVGKKLVV